MERMEIIQVAPYYYPFIGGVEEVVRQYSERLVKKGHSVTVFTSKMEESQEKLNGVDIKRFWSLPILQKGSYLPITPFLPFAFFRENPDLIHIHANKRFTTDSAALVVKLKKTPFVFSPHAGSWGKSFFGLVHNQTLGKIALSANVVICVSEFEKKIIEDSGLKINRFEILPNGVDLEEFAKKRENIFKNYGLNKKKIVLYVGRLAPHKGVDVLIGAIKKIVGSFSEAHLFLIGPDAGEENQLRKQVANLNLTSFVTFAGKLSRDDLISAYQNSSLFCLPSRNEAFGIAIIEAFAAGTPVITTKISSIAEIVTDGVNGRLVTPGDPEKLAAALLELLKEEKLGKSFAIEGTKVVEKRYNWEKIVDRLEDIYRSILR